MKGEDGLIYFKRCFHEENLPYQFCGLPDSQLRLGYDHVVSCMGNVQTIFATMTAIVSCLSLFHSWLPLSMTPIFKACCFSSIPHLVVFSISNEMPR